MTFWRVLSWFEDQFCDRRIWVWFSSWKFTHFFFCTILVNFDNSPPAVCFFKQFKMSTKQLHGKIVVGVVRFSSNKTLVMYKFCCKFCNVRYIISKQCKKWENFWHYSKYLIWPTILWFCYRKLIVYEISNNLTSILLHVCRQIAEEINHPWTVVAVFTIIIHFLFCLFFD